MCESVNELRCILYWSHIGPIRHVCIRCQWWYFEILDIVCPLYICWLIQSHLWYCVTGHKSLGMMGGGINNTLEHDTEGVKCALKASCPFYLSIHLWMKMRLTPSKFMEFLSRVNWNVSVNYFKSDSSLSCRPYLNTRGNRGWQVQKWQVSMLFDFQFKAQQNSNTWGDWHFSFSATFT